MANERQVTFVPSNGLDVEEWQRRHTAGDAPGAWPYGLDRLERFGLTPRFHTAERPRGRDLLALSPPRGYATDRVASAFSWDERGALRMLASTRADEVRSGVIWLNDLAVMNPRRQMYLRAVRRMRDVWVLSRAQIGPLREMLGRRSSVGVHWVPFGIDHEFFGSGTREVPREEPPLVFSAGNDRDRDFPTLLRAIPLVRKAVPGAKFLIQTRQPLEPPEGCIVVASLDHAAIRDLYHRASVTVVPTRPNLHVSGMTVMLEAMATGCASLISRTAGIESYVPESDDYTVCPGDVEGLAAKIIDRLIDSEKSRHLGARGAAFVSAEHSLDRMASELAVVLKGEG